MLNGEQPAGEINSDVSSDVSQMAVENRKHNVHLLFL